MTLSISLFEHVLCGLALVILLTAPAVCAETLPAKTHSVLYPGIMLEKAKANAAAFPWAAEMQKEIVERATPWLKMSDDDLWKLMFGPNIPRSWMVWSDGFCPACKHDVRMYTWEIDPWQNPWKLRCPHCKELFPKNDFAAFYRSGMDEHGVFQPERADRGLLFNAEHPGKDDPLRLFGVDDGKGYINGEAEAHRWRFIGCYLIYGQWKKSIVAGATNLSSAYLVTGDPVYARKTAILLDRVADLYPTFDFSKQGEVYEDPKLARGQITQWHDACEEDRELVLAYDRVFDGARAQEAGLTAFLSEKARAFRLDNPKKSWADIQRNIEAGILRETLAHRERIESNYPTTDRTLMIIKTVLDWPANREEILGLLDRIIEKATAVDGLSGEKGLAGYTAIAPRAVGEILAQFSRLEPGFLATVYGRHPVLHQTYRFHIDTWFMEQYYPHSGDSGGFAMRFPHYAGLTLSQNPGVEPSQFSFLWDLYRLTKDPAFVQVLHGANGGKLDGLPHDLFADDPAAFQAGVKGVIDEAGTAIIPPSVNKQQWRIAMLRSGQGENQRALWIDYDATERHSHSDGMNIGLFAKGLDLISEFGYPPVGYGGWGSPKARWYKKSASHVTVVVDGEDHKQVQNGVTKFWADGKRFHGISVSDPSMIEGKRFDRTVALIDLDERNSYVIDHFVVEGGKDHAKFFHAALGAVETAGLSLKDAEDYGFATEMRQFRRDENPTPGWSVDWKIEDRFNYLPEGRNIHLRYTDLTTGASASLAEAWVDTIQFGGSSSEYIPCIMTRRSATASDALQSVFVAVVEPYEGQSSLKRIRRLPLQSASGAPLADPAVGVEIERNDGCRDICIVTAPSANGEAFEPAAGGIRVCGTLGFVTIGPNGPERLVLCRGTRIEIGPLAVTLKDVSEFIEMKIDAAGIHVVTGDPACIKTATLGAKALAVGGG